MQCLEFIISRMNRNKKLVVNYEGQLISLNFLKYVDYENDLCAITDENEDTSYDFLESASAQNYWAHSVLYENIIKSDFNPNYIKIAGKKYTVDNQQVIDGFDFKNIVKFVEKKKNSAEYRLKKEVNVTPRNVEFIGTNVTLPFYVFPSEAEFTPVSLIDKKSKVNF